MAYFRYEKEKAFPYECSECGFGHLDPQSYCGKCHQKMEKADDEYLILIEMPIGAEILVKESCL